MNEQNITQFEQHLEKLIEGAFARFFSHRVRAQDIALHLARAMEDGVLTVSDGDPRPIAPDVYEITLHPTALDALLQRQPQLANLLSRHLVTLATSEGFRLENVPDVSLIASPGTPERSLIVQAIHAEGSQTAAMQRVEIPKNQPAPRNAQLLIEGGGVFDLLDSITNLGRHDHNTIVLDDVHASRHHAQIRLRFGYYTLFDIQSRAGTFVNDVRVKEHRLQPGDVIRIGMTKLIYLEDDDPDKPVTGQFENVDFD